MPQIALWPVADELHILESPMQDLREVIAEVCPGSLVRSQHPGATFHEIVTCQKLSLSRPENCNVPRPNSQFPGGCILRSLIQEHSTLACMTEWKNSRSQTSVAPPPPNTSLYMHSIRPAPPTMQRPTSLSQSTYQPVTLVRRCLP